MRERGLANWALSLGRQRARHAHAAQPPAVPAEPPDAAAAERDGQGRRRGARPHSRPRTRRSALQRVPPAVRAAAAASFDDFIDTRLPRRLARTRVEQERSVATLRDVYGQHRCDASKVITTAQLDDDGKPINDCLGLPERQHGRQRRGPRYRRRLARGVAPPHGSAISETQLQVFILNASRRLFSDRFFTSSFRPEFYTSLGVDWVNNNGPDGQQMERGTPNGHAKACRR